ncbi:DNA repair protein XRCC4-like isoform X1 [Acropora millepora]|uniref:DNA repair protein XRCC4-like isoform X1 n=1 Tax=Acropora millepora TaxID=45264 RepID=UPI001CF5E207|nr:DNA repair protein XRCC4-like isoform X1 [Acropora millepora]
MPQTFTRIEYGQEKYYLLVDLFQHGENGFDLTICNGKQIWRESVSSSAVASMAKAADMSVPEFAEQTGRALTGQTAVGNDNFVYQTKLQGKDLQFSWKKDIGDGVKFQLGSLTLAKVDDYIFIMTGIFDFAVNQMAQLKKEITALKSENDRLSSERKETLELLDQCVAAKEDMQKDLFEKFAAVLNEKKAKIRQLKESVHEGAKAAVAESVKDSNKPKLKDRALRRSDDTDDDTDHDDGMQVDDTPVRDFERETTTKQSRTTVFSPSLLPEEENEEIEPTVRRRRRREPKLRESPAAKLVLPKVPSVRKTPSSSSGESITPSRSRRQTSDKSPPDADDLMAEMENM